MKPPRNRNSKIAIILALVCTGSFSAFLLPQISTRVSAQNPAEKQQATAQKAETPTAATNASSGNTASTNAAAVAAVAQPPASGSTVIATNQASANATNQVVASPAPPTASGGAGQPSPAAAVAQSSPATGSSTNEIQLSFQGANIEMVVQWLANTTGKSVVKHPQVNCQLTIVSSKNLTPREAINLVYRALSIEGFNVVESSKSILIVPDGKEPKMNPELADSASGEIPEGRQRLIKMYPLKHVPPAELREKIKAVLSDKATVEIDERSNQIMVTDYNDNLRLLGDLVKELDVPSSSDSVIEIFPVKFGEAEDLANLLGLVLNAQSSGGGRGGSPSPSPGGPMPPGSGGPTPPGGGGGGVQAGSQVKIWPDKAANRLIVAAPKSKVPEIEKLLELLDTEKPQDVSVRVIPLKNVNAEDLVKEVGPLYQKIKGKSAKDTIEVTANNRSNSLIVLSSEANFKAIEKLIQSLDTEDAQEKAIRTFPLKNGDAEDVAKQLQELYQDQSSSSSRYFYYFSPFSNNSKKINVVADRRRNSVTVQAPPAAMEGIEKMIESLDEPVGDNSLAPRIYALKFVSAVDIEDVLNELFLKKQRQRSYWDYYENPEDTVDRNVGRLYGKVRITSEPYSNSIIITSNSPENLAAVEEVLKQLDVPSQAGETTVRLNLKFAEAITMANSMNILFAKGGSPPLRANPQQPGQPNDGRPQQQNNNNSQNSFALEKEAEEDAYYPWLGGQQENGRSTDGRNTTRPVSDLVGRVRVVPDKRSNSLLVTSNVHLLPQVLKLINDLDAPTAQVLIEAKIVEVSSDFRDRLGVRWSPDGTRSFDPEDFDNSIVAKSGAAYRDVFAGTAMADSLRTGVLNTSVNLDFLIQFLRKNSDATVLAEPQINIADNELGKLFVGAQVPFISNSLNTDVGGRNDTFQYRDVGIILEVTPHINNAEEVVLKIRAESSNIREGVTLFGGAILDTRNFRTELMVKTGQTAVLGGIIQRQDINTVRKVPLLGDIPGLGWAFKKKDKTTRETELMVFLRPRITRTPQEAQELLNEVEGRTPRIQRSIQKLQEQKEKDAQKN